jgi:hypothetical protein
LARNREGRGRHPSEGVVNPHFGVDPATGGRGPLRKRQGHHDGDFTVLDGSFTETASGQGDGWRLGTAEVQRKAEAIEWTKRFLSVAGESATRLDYGG